MIKKRFISMLALLMTAVSGAWADELTVHEGDGTLTNQYVPVYGDYCDAYLKCEMVMPATELSAMNGSEISAMTFYSSSTSVSWGSASFQVFLNEVSSTAIGGFSGPGTVVYEGALSIVGGEMTVTFTTPYTYNGGNLLIGVYNTANGSYVQSNWYGETVSGASVQGHNYTEPAYIESTQRNFLPKTTFTYSAPAAPAGIDLTPDATRKVWTLAEMPAYDVELQVEYYPGMFTFGGDAIEGGTVEVVGLTDDALPAGFEKDAEGNIYVAKGTTFTVKATPEEGYHFVCWSDDETNTNPEREITMPADGSDLSLSATFAENEYDITFSEGTNPDPENPEWTATPNPAKTKQTVTVTYSGSKKVIGVKAEKKAPAPPTLKDALADGATVVITYTWFDTNVTTFTYTNNGGTYTGNTTGADAGNFNNGMSKDGTTLKFTASSTGYTGIDVSIDFYTDTNEYVISKQSHFTSFTISVNGTDVTDQLKEVK